MTDSALTPKTVLDDNSHIGFHKWLEDHRNDVVVKHELLVSSLSCHCALAEWLTELEGEAVVVTTDSYRLYAALKQPRVVRLPLPMWAGKFVQFFGCPTKNMTGADCLPMLESAVAYVQA